MGLGQSYTHVQCICCVIAHKVQSLWVHQSVVLHHLNMTPNQVSSIPAAGALHCQRLQEHDTLWVRHEQLDSPISLSPPRHHHHRLQPGSLLSDKVKALSVAPNTPVCFTTYHHHLHKSHALVKAPSFHPYYVSSSPACREDPHCLG